MEVQPADPWMQSRLALVERIVTARMRRMPPGVMREDVVQVGRLGLCIAARHPERPEDAGDDWASVWIRREISNYLAGRGHRRGGELAYQFSRELLNERTDHQQALDAYQQATAAAGQLEEAEMETAIADASRGLTERQRELVDLVYRQGKTLLSIGKARSLGIGVRQVVNEHKATLKELERRLRAKGWRAA